MSIFSLIISLVLSLNSLSDNVKLEVKTLSLDSIFSLVLTITLSVILSSLKRNSCILSSKRFVIVSYLFSISSSGLSVANASFNSFISSNPEPLIFLKFEIISFSKVLILFPVSLNPVSASSPETLLTSYVFSGMSFPSLSLRSGIVCFPRSVVDLGIPFNFLATFIVLTNSFALRAKAFLVLLLSVISSLDSKRRALYVFLKIYFIATSNLTPSICSELNAFNSSVKLISP